MTRQQSVSFLAITALLAAAVVCTIGVLVYRASWPRTQVIRDDGGAIRHVACVASSARRSSLRNARLITDIVDALPLHTKITILTNDRSAFVVNNPYPQRVEFVDLPAEASFTIWPQDPFVILKNRDGNTELLASRDFDRADDRLIVQTLASHLGLSLRVSTFVFEGGNIVTGQRHAFVGANTILSNAHQLHLSPQEVAQKFTEELGRPVLIIGPAPQPIGHLDMMLTPLDGHNLMLADPGWGAELAERQLRDDPQEVEAFERACQEHFFGDPRIRQLTDRQGRTLLPPRTTGKTIAACKASRNIADHLNNLAHELERWGYKVNRVPYLHPPEPDAAPSTYPTAVTSTMPSAPMEMEAKPVYPCLTYNNVLLERTGTKCTVWVPQYGWAAFDRAAVEAWKKPGYQVIPVPGFTTSAMYGGSLRCCVKVLARDD